MNILSTLHCRGTAYEEDGALSCVSCGRLRLVLCSASRITGEYAPEPSNGPGRGSNTGKILHPPELKAICIGWLMEGE